VARRTAISRLLIRSMVGGFALSGGSLQAQQFSADLVSTGTHGRAVVARGKLYVSTDKVRIETPELPDGFLLVDRDSAHFVRPAARLFMDAKQSSRLTQVLVAVDPDDPCARWQAMATIAGAADRGGQWRCNRIGPDTVADRATIKYEATSPRHQASTVWIDPTLRFPVRLLTEGAAGIELSNIREAPQPGHLFEIPVTYRKFDPQALIDRIKDSDVWVLPPQ